MSILVPFLVRAVEAEEVNAFHLTAKARWNSCARSSAFQELRPLVNLPVFTRENDQHL